MPGLAVGYACVSHFVECCGLFRVRTFDLLDLVISRFNIHHITNSRLSIEKLTFRLYINAAEQKFGSTGTHTGIITLSSLERNKVRIRGTRAARVKSKTVKLTKFAALLDRKSSTPRSERLEHWSSYEVITKQTIKVTA